jgi:hypothetical protein
MKAYWGVEAWLRAYLASALDGSVVSFTPGRFTPRERAMVPTGKEDGWAPDAVWMRYWEERSFDGYFVLYFLIQVLFCNRKRIIIIQKDGRRR